MSARRHHEGAPPGAKKAAVAYLSSIYFADPTDADKRALTPLAGLATRYSSRAFALFVYLHLRADFENGTIRSKPADWTLPTETCHDPRTTRLALAELLGERDTPGGERIAVLDAPAEGFFAWTAECWRVREQVYAAKGEIGSPWAPVRLSASVVRGGQWGVLPDNHRLVYLALRLLAPAEIRHTKHRDPIGERRRTAAVIAKVTGLCEKTVLEAVKRLQKLCLIRVERHLFTPNLYSCPFDVHVRFLGYEFSFEYTLESQIPRSARATFRVRSVAQWHDMLNKHRPSRLRLA